MEKKKKAKFFCENCNSEVPAKAKFCPKCGKFFSSVRCPQCSYTGDIKEFIHGCPSCGYALNKPSVHQTLEENSTESFENKQPFRKRFAHNSAFSSYQKNNSTEKETQISGDVPYWLFGLSLVILGLIIFAFYQKCSI